MDKSNIMTERLSKAVLFIGLPTLALVVILAWTVLSDHREAHASGLLSGKGSRTTNLQVPRADGQNATVSGTVTASETGSGVENVEVFVWDINRGRGVATDTTRVSGWYSVSVETQRSYDFIFTPPCTIGLASQVTRGRLVTGDMTLDVGLPPGYTVSGTLFTTDGGTAPPGVSIYAFNKGTGVGFGLGLTKDYTYCYGLEEGVYDLGYTPPPKTGLGPTTAYSISVPPSRTLNITLPVGFTVSGRITSTEETGVSGVSIYALDRQVGGFGFAPSIEDGWYTGTLPTGTFDIQFMPPPGSDLGSITLVDVVSGTTEYHPDRTLNVAIPAGVTVSGTVSCGRYGLEGVFVAAHPINPPPADNDDIRKFGYFALPNGWYGLALVTGTYDFEFTPPTAFSFPTRTITGVQVITDISLNYDYCAAFLPLIFKNHPPPWITVTAIGDQAWGQVGPSSFCNANYKVALYAKTDIWYVQPYDDWRRDVQINPTNCKWESETHPWYQMAAHLVPANYHHPSTIRQPCCPPPPLAAEDPNNVLAASCYPGTCP